MITRFSRMMVVRQNFPLTPPLDIAAVVSQELRQITNRPLAGQRIAIGVGSRGILHLQQIVTAAVEFLKAAGAKPFIVPAMGSHGGATPEGQKALLADYGITPETVGVPIEASMATQQLGITEDGVRVFFSEAALAADGVLLINRVKPHTDFRGNLGSGLLKMLAVGLGKRDGAANFHLASSRLGYEHVLRSASRLLVAQVPLLGGLAIVENQRHETARILGVGATELETRESELFEEARRLMPQLPFDDVDLLIVDRMGKNISGAGLDPNVTGRSVHGYSSLPDPAIRPVVRRLFVRELTPESHGNATGVGMSDFTTKRLVQSIDYKVTCVNALTALSIQSAKIPVHFDSDREVVERALETLGSGPACDVRLMRITDTLMLETVELSEAYAPSLVDRPELEIVTPLRELSFDDAGNLWPVGRSDGRAVGR